MHEGRLNAARWAKNYSPKQINNLAGYIKTLKGTNPPNPKAPQGDLYTELPVVDTVHTQSLKPGESIKKDTSITIKKDSANSIKK